MMYASIKNNAPGRFPIDRVNCIIFLPIALLCTLLLFTACAQNTPSQTPALNQPESQIIDIQSSVVMKALLRVLADKKFKVNAERTNKQSLETEWLQEGSYRSMVQAEVLPLEKYRSQLKMNLLFQKKPFLQKTWQPVDKIDKTVCDEFMNKVLIESYRVLYDGR